MGTRKYPKMNQNVKRSWVKALRSGEYEQGQGTLCLGADEGERHCCLGVLYDVAFDDWWLYKDPRFEKAFEKAWSTPEGTGSLSPKQCEAVRLDEEAMEDLALMNDTGRSFKYIAAWIEKCL